MLKKGQAIPFFGDGSTSRDYTYIDDIIDGIMGALFSEDQFAIFNLGNSEPVKLDELVHAIGKRLNIEPELDRQKIPTGDVQQTFADVSRAKSRLNYMPKISIEDGIYQFVNWYETMMESNGKLFS